MKTLTKLLAVTLVLVMCVGMFGSGAYALVDNNGFVSSGSGLVDSGSGLVSSGSGLISSGSDSGTGLIGSVSDSGTGLIGSGSDSGSGLVDDNGLIGGEEGEIIDGVEIDQYAGAPQNVSLNGTSNWPSITAALADASAQATTEAKSVTLTLTNAVTEVGADIADQTFMRTITLNLNGKTLDLTNAPINVGDNNKLIITGSGTVKGTDALVSGSGAVNIWGGTYANTFTGIGPNATLYGGSYKANIDPADANNVLDGATIPDGCAVNTTTSSGTKIYTIIGAVASTNGDAYPTVGAAILAAADGGTVKLEKDSTAEALTVDKTLTIDLNGHSLKLSKAIDVEAALTIDDTSTGGRVVGNSSSGTLFNIRDVAASGSLTIAGGYMYNYSKLYARQTTGDTTPVELQLGSSYQVKPTNTADIAPGCIATGSSPVFYIAEATKPTVKIGTTLYDYTLFSRGLAGGYFEYDPQQPVKVPGNYTVTVSSKNLTAVEVVSAPFGVAGSATGFSFPLASNFNSDNQTVKIKASDGIYTGLVAGLYFVRFTFVEGVVDVPLYILPTVTAAPKEKVMPDAAGASVFFTFSDESAENFTYSFGLKSAGKAAAKALSATDGVVGTNNVEVIYDYLNENCVPGIYSLYCNYDARLAFPVDLKISGKTDASTDNPSNPPVTSSPGTTTTPTSTTAAISYNSANPYGLWYKDYSASLKFNVKNANTVEVGGYTLSEGVHYSISNNVLTLNNSYLSTLPYMHSSCINNAACANGSAYTIRVYSNDGTNAATTFQLKPYFAALNGAVNHTYGGSNTLTFLASDPIEQVYVGGTLLSTAYYTLSNYNRTLTLSSAFLNSQLTLGTFNLTVLVRSSVDNQLHKPDTVQFRNVTASYAASTSYAMGDNNNIYIWIAVLAICAVAVVALIPKKKKLPADAVLPEDTDKKE